MIDLYTQFRTEKCQQSTIFQCLLRTISVKKYSLYYFPFRAYFTVNKGKTHKLRHASNCTFIRIATTLNYILSCSPCSINIAFVIIRTWRLSQRPFQERWHQKVYSGYSLPGCNTTVPRTYRVVNIISCFGSLAQTESVFFGFLVMPRI